MVIRLVGLTADADHAPFLDAGRPPASLGHREGGGGEGGSLSLGLALDFGPLALARADAFVASSRGRASAVRDAVASRAARRKAKAALDSSSAAAKAKASEAMRRGLQRAEDQAVRSAKRAKQEVRA
jgi:hypothetical protein